MNIFSKFIFTHVSYYEVVQTLILNFKTPKTLGLMCMDQIIAIGKHKITISKCSLFSLYFSFN